MRVSVIAFIASTLATVAQAGPVASVPSMKVLDSITLEEGNLTFYGYDSELEARAVDLALERRAKCGDNIVSCDNRHEAYSNTCDLLRQDLVRRKNENLGAGNRKICRELDSKNRCCVSWANGINLSIGYLIPGFDSGYKCKGNAHANLISARIQWVLLAGKCNTQCLSNGDADCRN